nr:hypothetical protein [Tanacetum cinerariifolium]
MMDDVHNQGRMIAEIDQDADVVLEDDKEEDESKPIEVQDVVDVVTTAKIITEVRTATSENITAASTTITTAEAQVPTAILTAAPARVSAAPSSRRKKVVIRDPQEESTTSIIIPAETKSKDKGKGILIEEPKPIEEEESRALKRVNETPVEKATKRKKLDEEENQRSVHGLAKVKGWKLLESCGVQIITFTTTQQILLVERKYPLTRFTLDYMLNAVRLEIKEESEVSLELLMFIRQQHQEGAQLE